MNSFALTLWQPAMFRAIPFLRQLLRALPLVLVAGLMIASPARAADNSNFWDDPFSDLAGDVKQAKQDGKAGVFIFFMMDECPFCHRMETTVFTDPAVKAFMKKHFITTEVDINGDVMMTDLQGKQVKQKDFAFKQFRVRATPVMVFINTEGKVAVRFTGPTRSPEEFLTLARFVTSGAYQKPGMNFFKFRRSQQQ